MPKYSVDEVLSILRDLTPEEKSQLKAQLHTVLDAPSPSTASGGQQMTNTVSGTTFGDGNNAFNFQPGLNQGGNYTASTTFNQTLTHKQEILSALEKLQEAISNSEIDSLRKAGAEAQVEQLKEELKKPEPDKGLVAQTIATLKQGLEGVQTLAGPTIAVAKLIANAWGIPVV
ncbi:hypothetical protein QT972_14300 [Microcoleus sp. herbarium7]|uniref:hypothetical protein n=1 Tax=Microcoleus sp. herbarium7 TaxID=3055435 RepID=UPI002FD59709